MNAFALFRGSSKKFIPSGLTIPDVLPQCALGDTPSGGARRSATTSVLSDGIIYADMFGKGECGVVLAQWAGQTVSPRTPRDFPS
jgi:hypothetical protein